MWWTVKVTWRETVKCFGSIDIEADDKDAALAAVETLEEQGALDWDERVEDISDSYAYHYVVEPLAIERID